MALVGADDKGVGHAPSLGVKVRRFVPSKYVEVVGRSMHGSETIRQLAD